MTSNISIRQEIVDIAENVDDLVRDPAVMRNFRQQNGEFIRRKKAYEDAVRARQKEINKHCQKIINDKRLRDRKAGPPEKGMQWREEHSDDHDDPVEGWFPPATIEVPPNPWFYEPGNTADLTPEYMRPAQYLLLSLCHDYCLEHRPKIIIKLGFYQYLVKDRDGFEPFLRQHAEHLEPAYKDIFSDLKEILANNRSEEQTNIIKIENLIDKLEELKNRVKPGSRYFPRRGRMTSNVWQEEVKPYIQGIEYDLVELWTIIVKHAKLTRNSIENAIRSGESNEIDDLIHKLRLIQHEIEIESQVGSQKQSKDENVLSDFLDIYGNPVPEKEFQRIDKDAKKICHYQQIVYQKFNSIRENITTEIPSVQLAHWTFTAFEYALNFRSLLESHPWDDRFPDVVFQLFVQLQIWLKEIQSLRRQCMNWPKKAELYPCTLPDTPQFSALDTAIAFVERVTLAAEQAAKHNDILDDEGKFDSLPVYGISPVTMNVNGKQVHTFGFSPRPERRIQNWWDNTKQKLESVPLKYSEEDHQKLRDQINQELEEIMPDGEGKPPPTDPPQKPIVIQRGMREREFNKGRSIIILMDAYKNRDKWYNIPKSTYNSFKQNIKKKYSENEAEQLIQAIEYDNNKIRIKKETVLSLIFKGFEEK